MKLQNEHSLYIREAFNTMKTKEDFLALLNYAKVIVYGEKSIPFEQKQINYNSNPKANKKRYIKFAVKKKSGGHRIIHAPSKGLKSIQKCLNLIFQTIYDVSPAATGFVPGKSIVDNARIHAGSLYVYNIDLKDFFPSVEAGRIWNRFQHPPFNLNEKNGRKELANIITWLCCHEMEVERMVDDQWQKVIKNVLPQGAPTSPTLTNIICQQLDFYFSAVSKSFGLRYSRYADDITFSSMHNVYQAHSAIKNRKGQTFLEEIDRIIAEQNFHIKDSKTRLQKEGHQQMVTGLLVNEKANVPKRYIKQLRMWLYYWEQYGYDRASSFFLSEYVANKGHIKKGITDMASVIAGKLEYLKMVKGETSSLYKKLVLRFNDLSFEKPIIFSNDKVSIKSYKETILSKEKEFGKLLVVREKEIKDKYSSNIQDDIVHIIHDPKMTVWLLNKFTEDTYLKYTTHIWDRNKETSNENINRNSFYEEIKKEFYSKYNFQQLKEIGLNHLYWTIANFIAGPNKYGWGKYKLQFGWYNEQLKAFYLGNINKQPGSFLVPEEFIPNEKIEGKYLKYFDDFIDIFKNEIQFRGNSLYFILRTEFEKQLGFEYKVEYEGLKGIDIYTDTKQIAEVFQLIASNIRQHPEKNKNIKIRGIHRKAEKLYEIRIEDIDSFANAPIEAVKLMLKDKKGQLYKIRDLLISLCDFSIESNFRVDGDYFKGYELSYLSKDRKGFTNATPYIKKEIKTPIGFTYLLKFYE